MIVTDKRDFIKRSMDTLREIVRTLEKLPVAAWEEFPAARTAFVIVDMINGFAREGALQSPRVEKLIPGIAAMSRKCDERGIAKLAFADSHSGASPEFDSYPPHCMAGTSESEIVDEIRKTGGYRLIPKNSTNGFLEEEFQSWLKENPEIDTFIVAGDCTDICIQQFAITLKTWFNRQDKKSRIIVPSDAVDTYDLGIHGGDLMHVIALYNMMGNGVEVVKEIQDRA